MITLFAFFFSFSFSYVITIGVVWLTADDNDNPFTRFGMKAMLLRCAAFEFIPWIAGFVALAILAGADGIAGLLFGLLLAAAVFLGIMTWAAGLLFEREMADALILSVSLIGVNVGLAYGVPHLLSMMLL